MPFQRDVRQRALIVRWAALCLVMCGMHPNVATSQTPHDVELSAFRWENRILLVFTESADDSAYLALVDQIQRNIAAFEERDLVLVSSGEAPNVLARQRSMAPAEERALRTRYAIALPFEVILLGKDGGTKYRSGESVQLDTLFALIDEMPMRQREMRRSNEQ